MGVTPPGNRSAMRRSVHGEMPEREHRSNYIRGPVPPEMFVPAIY